jgi:hypothetical protein
MVAALRVASKQALEALQWHYRQGHSNTLGGFRLKIDEKALRELRAALEQQDEPVATLTAQCDALLEALKLARSIIGHPDDAHSRLIDAAIAAAEGEKK